MVTLDESRRYAVNYFRLVANAQSISKAAKKSVKDENYKIEDVDYSPLPAFEGTEQFLKFYEDTMLEQFLFELSSGFNLLFYGFGRKLAILELIKNKRQNGIFVNGYDLATTLSGIYSLMNKHGVDLRNGHGQCQRIPVIIYGLDSFKLRNENFYRLLADAAHRSDIQIVATVEDPNCGLLWSPRTMDKLNFIHHDVTTFVPYEEEDLESLPDIISSRIGRKRSIKGALFVLQSLTPNARAIFKLLAEHQIAAQSAMARANGSSTNKDSDSESDSDNDEEEGCQDGLAHIELYKLAQSNFLISNEQAFRTIMTEFLDHELIKLARSSVNGAEVLRIAFSVENIKEILSMMSTM